MRERKLKLNESKTEIMLIMGNFTANVTYEFGNLDVESSRLAPVNSTQNLGISFDPQLNFVKHIDTPVKNCNM